MVIGKLPNSVLHEHVLSQFSRRRREVIIGPKVGADCGIIDLGNNLCVISTDPITAASSNSGYLGVHIACNDIATTGAECVGITLTILAAPDTTLEDIKEIVGDVDRAAAELNIDVIGGHTEITDAVNKTVLSITAIGKVTEDMLVTPRDAEIGDSIVMTKRAGMEGSAILAHDRYDELVDHISEDLLVEAQGFLDYISVVPEGRVASRLNADGMHDATEGGVLGALWELSEIMGKGIEVHSDDIPIAFVTQEICNFYDIDPLKLISSGTMLIVTSDANQLVEELGKAGIESSIIGEVVDGDKKYIMRDGERRILEPPGADHLMLAYKS